MRLQIVSDLHIDINRITVNKFKKFIKPICDNLAILGDTCNNYNNENLNDLIKYCTDNFKNVFYIAGNHEYFCKNGKYTMNDVDTHFKNISYPNFHYLQRNKVVIDGIKIIGCTLWSKIHEQYNDDVMSSIGDYKYIYTENGLLTPRESNSFFDRNITWIKGELKEVIPTIIFTHHSPIKDSCELKYRIRRNNCAFSTDLEELIENNKHLLLWAFGHTHFCYYKKVGNCSVISNPKGYSNECPNFNSEYVIEI